MKILGALTIGIAIIATINRIINPAEAITILSMRLSVELFVGVFLLPPYSKIVYVWQDE